MGGAKESPARRAELSIIVSSSTLLYCFRKCVPWNADGKLPGSRQPKARAPSGLFVDRLRHAAPCIGKPRLLRPFRCVGCDDRVLLTGTDTAAVGPLVAGSSIPWTFPEGRGHHRNRTSHPPPGGRSSFIREPSGCGVHSPVGAWKRSMGAGALSVTAAALL